MAAWMDVSSLLFYISVIVWDSHPNALHDASKNNSENTKTYVEYRVVESCRYCVAAVCTTVKTL